MVTLRTTILIFLFLLAAAPQHAQTIISGGSVSGTWESEGNPYIISGNITVDADERLTLKPGVEVLFTGNYTLEIYGRMDANGTEDGKILFSLADTAGFAQGLAGWGGIGFLGYFSSTTEMSVLDHCIVEYSAGSGVICLDYPNLAITHVELRFNRHKGIDLYEFSDISMYDIHIHHNGTGGMEAQFSAVQVSDFVIEHNGGSGIEVSGSSYAGDGVLFENGLVAGNHTGFMGGGILVLMDANVNLIGVDIQGNSAPLGGGLYSSWATVAMDDVTLTGNQAGKGAGIYCDSESRLEMAHCLLAANQAETEGGALWLLDTELEMARTTITANAAGIVGGAIHHQSWYGTPAMVSSSILWGNMPDEVFALEGGPEISWSDVAGGYEGMGNMEEDPLFENAENGNYHLSWLDYPWTNSSKSPCIDAGDPGLPYDPDGTVADMGAYYYDQETITGQEEHALADLRCYPNPSSGIVNITCGTTVEKITVVSLAGQKILESAPGSTVATLDIGSVGTGVYILILETVNGQQSKVKLVRE